MDDKGDTSPDIQFQHSLPIPSSPPLSSCSDSELEAFRHEKKEEEEHLEMEEEEEEEDYHMDDVMSLMSTPMSVSTTKTSVNSLIDSVVKPGVLSSLTVVLDNFLSLERKQHSNTLNPSLLGPLPPTIDIESVWSTKSSRSNSTSFPNFDPCGFLSKPEISESIKCSYDIDNPSSDIFLESTIIDSDNESIDESIVEELEELELDLKVKELSLNLDLLKQLEAPSDITLGYKSITTYDPFDIVISRSSTISKESLATVIDEEESLPSPPVGEETPSSPQIEEIPLPLTQVKEDPLPSPQAKEETSIIIKIPHIYQSDIVTGSPHIKKSRSKRKRKPIRRTPSKPRKPIRKCVNELKFLALAADFPKSTSRPYIHNRSKLLIPTINDESNECQLHPLTSNLSPTPSIPKIPINKLRSRKPDSNNKPRPNVTRRKNIIKFKFFGKRQEYQEIINHIIKSPRLLNNELNGPIGEDIEIKTNHILRGGTALPPPFSPEFYDLKFTRFIPLHVRKLDARYALSKDKKSNFAHTKETKSFHDPSFYNVNPNIHELDIREVKSMNKQQKKLQTTVPKSFESADSKSLQFHSDRYFSRLNIYELSKILGLDQFNIILTKEVEINILDMFKNYCSFKLGYQTWIRGTTREYREGVIDTLYKLSRTFYPELNKFDLEVIVRRGAYSLMQTRLRKERRLMIK